MPVFSTFSSLSKYGFMGNNIPQTPTNFLNVVSNTYSVQMSTGAITSDGRTVSAGVSLDSATSPPSQGPIVITNRYGSIISQVNLYLAPSIYDDSITIAELLLGDNGNIFVVGAYFPNSPTGSDSLVAKLDNNLNLTWQKTLYTTNGESTYCGATGNTYLYLGGQTGTSGNVSVLSSYNFSGTLNFQKTVGNNCNRVDSLYVDSSDSYYTIANENAGAGVQGVQLMKWNSSNTYQWGRRITAASDIPFGENTTDVVVDTSGNVYVALQVSTTIYLLKYNSSGVIQWQNKIDTSLKYLQGMAIDTTGNVYILTLTDQTNLSPLYLFKFDSTGAVTWQRKIDGDLVTNNIFYKSQNSLNWSSNTLLINIVQSVSAGTKNSYILTLPDDGTKTGSYAGLITYSVSTLTTSTSTLTDASQANVSSTTSYTDATANALIATTTFSQSVTPI